MKDLPDILKYIAEYAGEYLRIFLVTLTKVKIAYPSTKDESKLLGAVADDNDLEELNPKIFQYVLFSIFMGFGIQAACIVIRPQDSKSKPLENVLIAAILVCALSVVFAFLLVLLFKYLFHSDFSYKMLLSGALQLQSTLYVLSSIITVAAVLLSALLPSTPPYFTQLSYAINHVPLCVIYYSIAGRRWRSPRPAPEPVPPPPPVDTGEALGSCIFAIIKVIFALVIFYFLGQVMLFPSGVQPR